MYVRRVPRGLSSHLALLSPGVVRAFHFTPQAVLARNRPLSGMLPPLKTTGAAVSGMGASLETTGMAMSGGSTSIRASFHRGR
jgi:hypothetical protein